MQEIASVSSRFDLSIMWKTPHVIVDVSFLVLLAFSGAFCAFYGSIPKPLNFLHRIYIVPLFFWILWNLYRLAAYLQVSLSDTITFPFIWLCFLKLLLVALIPFFLLLWIIRKGLSPYPKLSIFSVVLSSFSLGALVVHLSCSSQNFGHMFLFHFFPVVLFSGISIWFGRFLINKV